VPGRATAAGLLATSPRCIPPVEERRLGPVEVVEHDHERTLRSDGFEEPLNGCEALFDTCSRLRESNQLGDAAGNRERFVAGNELYELRFGVLRGIALEKPRGLTKHLSQREVRDSLAVRQAAALKHERAFVDRVEELRGEPRLADSGGAEDGEELRGLVTHSLVERVPKTPQLTPPTDHRRVEAAGTVYRPGWHLDEAQGANELRLPFQALRLDRLGHTESPDQTICRLRDQDRRPAAQPAPAAPRR
jgi:hypothetical protein